MPGETLPFWLAEQPLVLASGSATRRHMLQEAGLRIEAVSPHVDEREVESRWLDAGRPLGELAGALAAAKAMAVSALMPGRLVLGADQTLICLDRVFHKPGSRGDAARQLAILSGREHKLTSAACLAQNGAVVETMADEARLTMRTLDPPFIDLYVEAAGDAVLSSVGGYQIEKAGIHLFERIDGDHATILGLPLLKLLGALRRLRYLAE